MSDTLQQKGPQTMEGEIPRFEPRIPEYLLDKMTPAEREIFCRLDVNSQQTEHTLRIVMQGQHERLKVVASVDKMQKAHADHCEDDKRSFDDIRAKQSVMSTNLGRCASTLDRWDAKAKTVGSVLGFFFGRKGLATAALVAVVSWLAVEYTKAHLAANRSHDPLVTRGQK